MHDSTPPEPGSGPPIVAVGDSITWGFPYGPYASWVRRVADAMGVEIRNLGVNGDTLADMRARIPGVVALRPRCCVVTGGTNDASQGRSPEQMAEDTGAMVEALREADVFPLIGTPPPDRDPYCEKQLAAYRHFINAYAGTRGVRVIHFDRAFLDAEGVPVRRYYTDATHPSQEGYEAMARHVVDSGAFASCLGTAGG
jgi:acyl-CoA thioesterase-1